MVPRIPRGNKLSGEWRRRMGKVAILGIFGFAGDDLARSQLLCLAGKLIYTSLI